MIRRVLLVLGFVGAFLPLSGRQAHACLCASGDPRAALDASDAAFIGRLIARTVPEGEDRRTQPAYMDLRFVVDEPIKGELENEVVIRSAGACGVSARLGWTIGLFLDRQGNRWTSSSCAQEQPDVLRRIAEPLPAPNSRGPVALLVGGQLAESRTVALDRAGGIVAYGRGQGRVAGFSICDGSRRFVEAVTDGRASTVEVALRDLATLEVVVSRHVEELEGARWYPEAISCRDRSGSDVFVAGRDDFDLRVVRITNGRSSVVYDGLGLAFAFSRVRDVAYLGVKKSIMELDMTTGRVRIIASLPLTPTSISRNADDTFLAGTNGSSGDRGRTFTVRRADGEVRIGKGNYGGEPLWIDRRTFIVSQGVYDTSARPVEFRHQYLGLGRPAVVAAGSIYSVGDGVLSVTDERSVRLLRAFDSPYVSALAFVRDGPVATLSGDVRIGPLAGVMGVLMLIVVAGLTHATRTRRVSR